MKDRTIILWILRRVSGRIPMLVLMTLANAGSALFGVLFALGTRGVIDSAVAGDTDAFFRASLIQLGVICGLLFFWALARYLRDRLATELDRDWKQRLLRHLLYGEYAQVTQLHSGELINRLNNDVRILNEGILGVVPGLVSILVRLSAAILVLFALEPVFTGILLAVGVVAVLATGVARRGLKRLHKQVSQADGRVLSFLQEVLEKLLVVQSMDLNGEVQRRSDRLLDQRLRIQRRRRWVSLGANVGVSILYYAVSLAALVWCSYGMLRGRVSFGTLSVVLQLSGQIQTPFVSLSGMIPQYAAMTAAAERLMELEQIRQEPQDQIEDLTNCYDNLEFIGAENITFAYDEEETFRQASFSLPKGTFAVIMGSSGIGKSTLLKLMLGVYAPEGGRLYAKSADAYTTLSRKTRKLFAYVPQGNFLFSGTLRENILLSNPDGNHELMDQAIYVSAMDRFLDQLPDGLDSVIGEHGEGLSEGQAQRLAIARAVFSGAPILLLDEATSALDGETERLVLERISRLPGHTCIAVTHRPAALDFADWSLEISDKGIRVEEVGR